MKGQYFLKDKKAQVYQYTEGGRNENGFPTGSGYVPIAVVPLWCYTKQLSQDQIYAAMAVGQSEQRLFVFNYRDDIEVGCYIAYGGKFYLITRVDVPEDYKTDIFVYVKLEGRTGLIPENILPYGTPIIRE